MNGYTRLLRGFTDGVYIDNNEKVMKILVFQPFQFKEQEKTNGGHKHKLISFAWCIQPTSFTGPFPWLGGGKGPWERGLYST